MYARHEESTTIVPARVEEVFAHLDDHGRLAGHMSQRSWMMGGGRMETTIDAGGGKSVGSHIRVHGRVFGLMLSLDEVVVQRRPPAFKAWETVGEPRLLVIGPYRMSFSLESSRPTQVTVAIDYELPRRGVGFVLGRLLGGFYARWCVRRMTGDVARAFSDIPQRIPDKGPVRA